MRYIAFGLGLVLATWTYCGLAADGRPGLRPLRAAERKNVVADAAVKSLELEWQDAARHRALPAKIYYPEGTALCPVIVVSHCLGGSREDYAYLGNAWAAHGYVSVHLQHLGSDVAERQGLRQKSKLRHVFEDAQNTIDRARDVIFALNQLEMVNRENPQLAGRLDLARIGLAGHAFGSLTALNVAGQPLLTPDGQMSLADSRVKAALAMSTPVPQQRDALDQVYRPIHIPVMHMTGTKDESPFGTTHIADRRIPYDHIAGVDQYLITFRDADHMVYVGHKLALVEGRRDPAIQALVVRCSLLFWDAYLKEDTASRAALAAGQIKTIVGSQALVESKLAGSSQQPAVGGGRQL